MIILRKSRIERDKLVLTSCSPGLPSSLEGPRSAKKPPLMAFAGAATHHASRLRVCRMSTEYRRRYNSPYWHWHEDCPHWPTDRFQTWYRKPTKSICFKCEAKSREEPEKTEEQRDNRGFGRLSKENER